MSHCEIQRNVSEAFPHRKHGNYRNDIALLKLEEPLDFSASISAIELATKEVPVNSKVTISGWGRTYTRGPISVRLKYNSLKALSQNDCAFSTGINYKGLICLGHSAGKGACNVS